MKKTNNQNMPVLLIPAMTLSKFLINTINGVKEVRRFPQGKVGEARYYSHTTWCFSHEENILLGCVGSTLRIINLNMYIFLLNKESKFNVHETGPGGKFVQREVSLRTKILREQKPKSIKLKHWRKHSI